MVLKTTRGKPRGTPKKAEVQISPVQLTSTGIEIWTITRDGKTERLRTSVSSTSTMDVATSRYDSALKRLAKT